MTVEYHTPFKAKRLDKTTDRGNTNTSVETNTKAAEYFFLIARKATPNTFETGWTNMLNDITVKHEADIAIVSLLVVNSLNKLFGNNSKTTKATTA